MDAETVVDALSEAFQDDPQGWSTVSDRVCSQWSDEPQVAAMIAYLDGLSDFDRTDMLTSSSQLDTLRGWLADGSFDQPAEVDESPLDEYEAAAEPLVDAGATEAASYGDAQYPSGYGSAAGESADLAPGAAVAAERFESGSHPDDELPTLDGVFTFEQIIELLDVGVLEARELNEWVAS